MNVISPDLMWIDGKCYRLPALSPQKYEIDVKDALNEEWQFKDENETYTDSECNADDYAFDYLTNELERMIQNIAENRFELKLPVSQQFWPQIIGSKGATKKRIENDTKTRIIVPKPMEHGDIHIRGSTKRDILLASKYISSIVFAARQKLTFTHFISLPLNNESIKTNFIRFKEEVLKNFGDDRGIDESIFQKPEKLHATIGTLVLTDQRERKIAEDILQEVFIQLIKPILCDQVIEIEMKGIEYMNDDPTEVDVLYGKVNSLGNQMVLQNLADGILNYFSQRNLVKISEKQQVKLHVTLMNTLFREEELEKLNIEIVGPKNNKVKKNRKTFNAINILEKFQNYYFGKKKLDTIELSVRFSTAKNGYYKSSSVIHL